VRPIGVHHVSLNVDDVDAAVAFYVDVLGLTVCPDRPKFAVRGAWLDAGDRQVHLIEGPPPPALGQHFALALDDLPAAVSELRSRGVEVSDPEPVGAGLQSFLTDPAGNLVELQQPLR
jgi:catechol 2,3-dioxygenase-like lactoylglutathione lyase family enzyme